jgi:hypothetical protein
MLLTQNNLVKGQRRDRCLWFLRACTVGRLALKMARKGLSLLPQNHVYFSFITRFARKGERVSIMGVALGEPVNQRT